MQSVGKAKLTQAFSRGPARPRSGLQDAFPAFQWGTMNQVPSLADLDVAGRRVLVRVDFNVPLEDGNGTARITDDTRITAAVPTIEALRGKGAKVILMSHLGRPKGKPNAAESLAPVARHLGGLLGTEVAFAEDCVGPEAVKAAEALAEGGVLLLENLRFHAEEEANDPAFAAELAKLGEVFVNDAFGAAHRAHASTAGVAVHFENKAAGLLMQRELKYLVGELAEPARPFVVIMGGKKVSDKILAIRALLEKADTLLIGGAMAYTFLKAQGHEVGDSLVEEDKLELARELLAEAKAADTALILPADSRITQEFKEGAKTELTARWDRGGKIDRGWEGIDIGPEAIAEFSTVIARAGTILWNGPMGVFEIDAFAEGTRSVAEAVAKSNATSIIGGGDSVTALNKFGLADAVTFCSTGGGASLELLEGKELPGVTALA